ncbi:MAG: hypothetical protein A3I66_21045 [Burkholderiales bacterium RIFCSPLOWO2_02_FULL_57_36]|nr:MAG: hypothetical protein A3I66_21045 [Burkholderiales bacterium RIFCSPLOWO2_02_FULL_57_36]
MACGKKCEVPNTTGRSRRRRKPPTEINAFSKAFNASRTRSCAGLAELIEHCIIKKNRSSSNHIE